MGSLAPELALDLKLFARNTIGCVLKQETTTAAGCRAAKLEDIVRRLEEERLKIEAFKRELPLCMILLTDVIGGMKLELEQFESGGRGLEEFVPIKSKVDGDDEGRLGKKSKMDWMNSALLWSDYCSDESVGWRDASQEKKDGESDSRKDVEIPLFELGSGRAGGGAFQPFKAIPAPKKEEGKLSISLPDLSLVPPEAPADTGTDNLLSCSCPLPAIIPPTPVVGENLGSQPHQRHQPPPPPSKKERRCWSPELHRRFVNALQNLGGAQVATPKQIRELMKVDGLTNDEVKSHLQKYRLHTRRMPSSSTSQANKPVLMVGGLWVSQQDDCLTSQNSASQSASPQGPLQLGLSVNAGDSCEDDGKSESYSWK
ncbi:Two-component response regulator ARR14 [Apostasia shenzhenica]|uniref:Two-component response regulator ARR14 n=1 Tax=Apostasia shenzhenica TaxID=1088818 RepID=A0A2I0BDP8_9ASPA|nr:Two-component response regulator ARR14 [Apostasia shenzhenica]